MKRIRIIAAVFAIVTALAVYLYLSSVQKPADIQRAPVVLAVTAISAGQEVKAEMVEVKQLPVEAIHPQAARSIEEVVGRLASKGSVPGEQLLVSGFFKAGEANDTLAYAIERGKRAVTIAVDPISGVSGLIKPRDHVDVLVTLGAKTQHWKMEATLKQNSADVSIKLSDFEDRTFSLLPLQNILVLATGQVTRADASNKETTVEQITLSVTPEQAVTLNYIASNGQLRLALRSPVDTETVDIKPKDIDDIIRINTLEELIAQIKDFAKEANAFPTPGPSAPEATSKP